MAQKCCAKWTKCYFSTTDRGLLTKILEFTDEGFSNSPWRFHQNNFVASKITAFTILFSVFQNYAEKWTVTCNVQCSSLLNSRPYILKHVVIVHASFRTSSTCFCAALCVTLLFESCDSWSRINCKTFFSSSVFFGLGWSVF